MKILHCIPSISNVRGGPSVAVLEMVKSLRDRGVDARILTTNDAGAHLDYTMPLGSWFEYHGVPVLAFPRWSPRIACLREYAISLGFNQWLFRHIRDFQILHVHAMFSWTSTSAMLQARIANIPYVLSTIGQLNTWSLSQHSFRKRLYLGVIESRNLAGASALHFTTKQEMNEASTSLRNSCAWVVPLGVNPPSPAKPRRAQAEQVTTFLFLSRIHPKKQLECLLEALALLQHRNPNAMWRLNIAGDGDPHYLLGLRQSIETLGLSNRCNWLGFLTGHDKWNALENADWFILPSASENFGIAVIEALAVGTPPIITPDVAVSDAISAASAGYVCSSSPLVLSDVLERALSGPSDAMKIAAINLASGSYSWASIAKQLEQLYLTIINH